MTATTPDLSSARILGALFSGVVLNQNATASDSVSVSTKVYQTFRLPADLARATQVPELTGLQVCVGVTAPDAKLTWTFEHKSLFADWTILAQGTAQGAPAADTQVWVTCLFDAPVSINGMTSDTDDFRFSIQNTSGVSDVWFSSPNPFIDGQAFGSDGSTPLLFDGAAYSLMFRLLAAVADSGTDFLGNPYRSLASRRSITDTDARAGGTSYWLSEPQPSQFAVVSLYYDMRDSAGNPQVVDSVLLDPVTPNVWAHLYYCNDGNPGANDTDWEERVWIPIPRSYQIKRRDTFALPAPVQAKYLKIEFSHLQAQTYDPGQFQKSLSYKKHPKWVLDYFLLLTQAARPSGSTDFISSSTAVTYNAYDLLYTYYQDDLQSHPDAPTATSPADLATLQTFLSTNDDLSDQVDPHTAAQISIAARPFLSTPGSQAVAKSLLGDLAFNQLAAPTTVYPVETLPNTTPDTSTVSSLDREAVILEQTYPVMYFFVACRHRYREAQATLSQNRAYFVGLNEVTFLRANYAIESDTPMYVEQMGDYLNAERNDFIAPPIPTVDT